VKARCRFFLFFFLVTAGCASFTGRQSPADANLPASHVLQTQEQAENALYATVKVYEFAMAEINELHRRGQIANGDYETALNYARQCRKALQLAAGAVETFDQNREGFVKLYQEAVHLVRVLRMQRR
jgi:hypothetical protein